jgi:hypothetical protein
MRLAAFEHVRALASAHDLLTAAELKPGFVFDGQRIPLVNPQRGIFKPQEMRFLLSIKTVFPRPGGKVWYDDQRQVHRQIFEGDETVDYAFMGQDPSAADNRWLREAFEHRIPIIYFLGIAPGRYQPMLPAFISGWDKNALKARVAFGLPGQDAMAPPESAVERRYALRSVKQRLHQASFREAVIMAYDGRSYVGHQHVGVGRGDALLRTPRNGETAVRLDFGRKRLSGPGSTVNSFRLCCFPVIRVSSPRVRGCDQASVDGSTVPAHQRSRLPPSDKAEVSMREPAASTPIRRTR